MGHSTHIKSLGNDINSIVCDQGQQSGAATVNVKHPNSIAALKRLGLRYYRREDIASRVNTFTDVENVAAQIAIEKAGFTFTKRAEKFYQAPQLNGEHRDVFHYELRG